MDAISSRIVDWHRDNGGSNKRLAGHALRLLREAVEVCVAGGADADEIAAAIKSELFKAHLRNEFGKPVDPLIVRGELADVTILADILAHFTGDLDMASDRSTKLAILHERKWQPDADGVLWRPGTKGA